MASFKVYFLCLFRNYFSNISAISSSRMIVLVFGDVCTCRTSKLVLISSPSENIDMYFLNKCIITLTASFLARHKANCFFAAFLCRYFRKRHIKAFREDDISCGRRISHALIRCVLTTLITHFALPSKHSPSATARISKDSLHWLEMIPSTILYTKLIQVAHAEYCFGE